MLSQTLSSRHLGRNNSAGRVTWAHNNRGGLVRAIQSGQLQRLGHMRVRKAIISDIEAFSPEGGDWRGLDFLLEELWEAGVLEEHLLTLLGVFERFPTEDGAGVLWGIVHGIEASPFDYEAPLQRSIDRQPSFMGNLMLQRLEKSRATHRSSGSMVASAEVKR